jgi:hypothetical protein
LLRHFGHQFTKLGPLHQLKRWRRQCKRFAAPVAGDFPAGGRRQSPPMLSFPRLAAGANAWAGCS